MKTQPSMFESIPTDLMIAAQARIAAQSGVSIIVTHKGDSSNGAIFLKINLLDGTALVVNRIQTDRGFAWIYALGSQPVAETEADLYLSQQIDFDPDLWTVEVEDKQGRIWFDGPLLETP